MPWKKETILRRMTKTSLQCSNVNNGCFADVVDAHQGGQNPRVADDEGIGEI